MNEQHIETACDETRYTCPVCGGETRCFFACQPMPCIQCSNQINQQSSQPSWQQKLTNDDIFERPFSTSTKEPE
jgi:hypothetical protein